MTVDRYTWKARVQPVLLVAFPVALVAFAAGATQSLLERLGTTVLAFGVAAIVVGMARDRGKRLESELWASWGGPPTTTLMLSTTGEPSLRLVDYRRNLARLLPDASALTNVLEAEHPEIVRQVTARYGAYLRERTRDRGKFPTVADTNATYGFRRNCLGLRPVAVCVALAATALGSVLAWARISGVTEAGSWVGLCGASLVSLLIAFAWWRCESEWVRRAAVSYAEALLESAEGLEPLESAKGDSGP